MRRVVDGPIEITSRHGATGKAYAGSKFGKHLGFDYAGEEDRDGKAPIPATVVRSYLSASAGNVLEIKEDKNGRLHRLMHLKKVLVKVGDHVDEGQVIAKTGGKKGEKYSGTSSTGPHVHHDVRKAGTKWDESFDNYLNWEDLLKAANTPPPAAPAVPPANRYKVHQDLDGYRTSADAANRQHSNSRVPAGEYAVFNQAHGMINVTRKPGVPGWWINPNDNVATPAPAPAPAAPAFKVGDKVAPTSPISYTGQRLKQYDPSYTISEIDGDRAVLKARGAVWAAVNTKNLRHV